MSHVLRARAISGMILAATSAVTSAGADAVTLDLRAAEAYDSGDVAEAARLWRESAEAGLPAAMVSYGALLEDGDGVAADPQAARDWYARAAELGDAHAMVLVAGALAAARPDDPQINALYRAAAARGHLFALSRLAPSPGEDGVLRPGATGETDQ